MIPVEGHKNLFRDPETGAIINNNMNEYSNYRMDRKRKMDQKAELDEMKRDIDEIKSLLKQLVNYKA
tara:strand:+ start:1233 stop:1433 length:201 start_codon:yes stop_codon:yes gene_type:complete